MKPGQLLTRVLLGGCAVLVLVGGMMLAGLGQGNPPRDVPDRSLDDGRDAAAQLGKFRLPELSEYAEVAARPLFNDDRRPREPDPEGPAEDLEGPGEEVAPVALNVAVKGIIITDDIKLALVQDRNSKAVYRLREGMPMEGDQGAWVLTRIEPRELVFEGGGDEPARVELKTHKKALKSGAAGPPVAASRPGVSEAAANPLTAGQAPAQAAAESPGAQSDQERAAKAEEIRRRVAERRAQLRAEAARRRAEQEKDKE